MIPTNSIVFEETLIGLCIAPSKILLFSEIKYLVTLGYTVVYKETERFSSKVFYSEDIHRPMISKNLPFIKYKYDQWVHKLEPFKSKDELDKYFLFIDSIISN